MRKSVVALVVGCLLAVSCGSDSTSSSTDAPTSEAPAATEPPVDELTTADTEPTATEPPATEPTPTEPAPAATEPSDDPVSTTPEDVEPDDTTSEPADTDTTGPDDSGPDSTDTDIDDEFEAVLTDDQFPLDQIDDAPVCQSFARFFNRLIRVSFAALFVGLDEEIDGPTGDVTAEKLELVEFIGTADDAALLRESLPAAIVAGFEPLLDRAEAVDRILTDAGFSADELSAIAAAVQAGTTEEPGETPLDDDPRLTAAAEAMVAEFGPVIDAIEALDTIGAADEDEADAFLEDNCPELAVLFADQG